MIVRLGRFVEKISCKHISDSTKYKNKIGMFAKTDRTR